MYLGFKVFYRAYRVYLGFKVYNRAYRVYLGFKVYSRAYRVYLGFKVYKPLNPASRPRLLPNFRSTGMSGRPKMVSALSFGQSVTQLRWVKSDRLLASSSIDLASLSRSFKYFRFAAFWS